MNANQITTRADFMSAAPDQQLAYKTNHKDAYMLMWASETINLKETNSPVDWKNPEVAKELSFNPADIKTPDDFFKLSDTGKLYLKQQFPNLYSKIWEKE